MRKFSLLIMAAVLTVTSVSAQSPEYPLCVSANMGASIAGTVVKRVYKLVDRVDAIKADLDPAWQITADYSLNRRFSLGAAFSQQKLDLSVEGYLFKDRSQKENFEATVKRTNFAVRGLVHYGNFTRADFYSGLRLGITRWSASTSSLDPQNEIKKTLTLFAPQLIVLGIRGYFTNNIGANVELAVGSPHFISFGLNFRLGKFKSE